MAPKHLTAEEIDAGLSHVLASPKDLGQLQVIVVRPQANERRVLQSVQLSPEGGIEGDRWGAPATSEPEGGGPDPRIQVSLMNARILQMIAGDDERMALAGDNLIVDLDLSEDNIPVGQKLAVGEALLQVTDVPHTGCGKFSERFGPDAVRFINAAERRSLHLRGIYARILQAGTVHVGEVVRKVD
jgi:MOSC domain-containing protein YiiM